MINKNYIVQGFVWLLSGISAFAMPIITTDAKDVPVNAQQPIAAGFVVHNSNAFYAAPGSIASSTKIVVLDNPTANVEIAQLYPANQVSKAVCVQKPTKQRKHTHKTTTATAEVEKPIAQKTTVACPFGNYPTHSNSFYALHNGTATVPTFFSSKKFTSKYFIKTLPITSPDLSGGEFSYLSNYLSSLWRELVPISREVRGEVTTRPPPFSTT